MHALQEHKKKNLKKNVVLASVALDLEFVSPEK